MEIAPLRIAGYVLLALSGLFAIIGAATDAMYTQSYSSMYNTHGLFPNQGLSGGWWEASQAFCIIGILALFATAAVSLLTLWKDLGHRLPLFIQVATLLTSAACLIVCVTIFMPEIQKRKYTGHQSTIKMGYSGALLCVSAVLSVAGAAVAIADLIVGESSSESTPYPPSPHPFVVNKVQGYSRDVE